MPGMGGNLVCREIHAIGTNMKFHVQEEFYGRMRQEDLFRDPGFLLREWGQLYRYVS